MFSPHHLTPSRKVYLYETGVPEQAKGYIVTSKTFRESDLHL